MTRLIADVSFVHFSTKHASIWGDHLGKHTDEGETLVWQFFVGCEDAVPQPSSCNSSISSTRWDIEGATLGTLAAWSSQAMVDMVDMDCHSVKGAVRPGELKFLNGRHRRAHWTSLDRGVQSGRTNAHTQAVAPRGGLMLSCLEGDLNEIQSRLEV